MFGLQSGFLQDPWALARLRGGSLGRPRGESSARRPEDPQDKSQAPGKEAPEGHKERLTPQGGGTRQRVCTLGFRVLSSVDGQAYAGCLALSSMDSMAAAIRNSTMRCWGPRGPKTEPFPVSQEILTLIEVYGCRTCPGCWPPSYGWDRPKRAWVGI